MLKGGEAISLGRDDCDSAAPFHFGYDSISVIGLICNDVLCQVVAKHGQGRDAVVDLASGELQAHRIAQSIDEGMNLGCQAAAAAADGLGIAPPLPPAEC